MSSSARSLGLGLAVIATVGILFTTIFREWKRNSVESSQANFLQLYASEGLWVRCTSPLPGQFQCDQYDTSFLGLQRKSLFYDCFVALFAVRGIEKFPSGVRFPF